MLNFRVNDRDAVLAKLRAEGIVAEPNVHAHENGGFGWIMDPDGTHIELWQPPSVTMRG